MNVSRVALAAVAAWIVDAVYGFCVYGKALESEFARYPDVFRPMAAMNGNLPLMFAGSLLAFFALAYIFAKGHEGGSGLAEGLRFGFVVGVFEFGVMSIGNYATLNVGRKIAVHAIQGLRMHLDVEIRAFFGYELAQGVPDVEHTC